MRHTPAAVSSREPFLPLSLCAGASPTFGDFLWHNLLPVTLGLVLFRSHIFFVFMWICGTALGTQTHHSGYRFPWIAGGDHQPEFHDAHHRKFLCNYGNIGLLDYLHGTYQE